MSEEQRDFHTDKIAWNAVLNKNKGIWCKTCKKLTIDGVFKLAKHLNHEIMLVTMDIPIILSMEK